jgi:hypothetical protein
MTLDNNRVICGTNLINRNYSTLTRNGEGFLFTRILSRGCGSVRGGLLKISGQHNICMTIAVLFFLDNQRAVIQKTKLPSYFS